METQTSSNYLSTAALRHRWGFHAESIRRIIRQRRLPSVRIGKRILIARADVEAFELKHRTEAKEST
jgi:excisionase family DNA binding protein